MATDTATGSDAIETSSDDDDGGSSSTRPEYVSLFVLFGAMLMVALLCSSWYILSRRERRLFNAHPHDAEAAQISLAAARLDAIAPVISQKRWRPFKASKPPPSFQMCVICLDEVQGRQGARNLPCGHGFHDECITKWFTERQEVCPVCKRNYGLGTTNVYVALPPSVFIRP